MQKPAFIFCKYNDLSKIVKFVLSDRGKSDKYYFAQLAENDKQLKQIGFRLFLYFCVFKKHIILL